MTGAPPTTTATPEAVTGAPGIGSSALLCSRRHVVNTSGGVCSALAACRVVAREGPQNVTLLFADVLMEDEDLYRFNREVSEYLGVPITRISLEKTPWQLFGDEGMIGNSRSPICSVKLKREPLDEWHRANTMELTTTLYIGIDWTEEHRLHHMRIAKPTWRIEAPMCEPPLWDKCRMLEEVKSMGIKPPRLYTFGFPHNNCGGFCVKAGQAQFALLLRTMPDRYRYHEEQEEALRQRFKAEGKSSWDYSILTDRRGDGKKKPLTLRRFRERIEAGESFDRHDWGGCGCALDSEHNTELRRGAKD